jgi:ADP-heptose:LPS heptosyltransferase
MGAPHSVLIFHIGSLGDTLVSLPALWAVREHFPGARLTLLCDHHPRRRYVLAPDLLRGCGAVDDFMLYPVDNSRLGRVLRPVRMLKLLLQLRSRRFDVLVYLPPSRRSSRNITRDLKFFRLAGIPEHYGTEMGTWVYLTKVAGVPLAPVAQEGERLLQRLAASGIPVPPLSEARMDLGLGAAEQEAVDAWRRTLPPDGERRWISVGPGGKKDVSRWPEERYRELVLRLIDRFDVWPVVFGGAEDREMGERLTAAWGRGYVAAGQLGLRETCMAMRRCALHVGNDTGTIHLAAAAPIPCVGVYPSQDPPGEWFPWGTGHVILRTPLDCEGCFLHRCVERGTECLMSISADDVFRACAAKLESLGLARSPAGVVHVST